jgi:hypothetical protein
MNESVPTDKIINCIIPNKLICWFFIECSRERGIMGAVMMTNNAFTFNTLWQDSIWWRQRENLQPKAV